MTSKLEESHLGLPYCTWSYSLEEAVAFYMQFVKSEGKPRKMQVLYPKSEDNDTYYLAVKIKGNIKHHVPSVVLAQRMQTIGNMGITVSATVANHQTISNFA